MTKDRTTLTVAQYAFLE